MRLLGKILFPISLLYGIVVHTRNFLYDIKVFKSKAFQTPTICVGNLSVGGTGKTPMIEYLIKLLHDDYKIAMLSRGYRRKSKGFQMAGSKSSVEVLGDEPFQIHSKFKSIDVAVAVDANRCNGIRILEKNKQPDIILLDDAFQHRKVIPSFSILLTTYDNLYVDDFFLPTGSLRDAKNQVKRANLIIVTKCPENLSKEGSNKVSERIGLKKQVIFAHLSYSKVFFSLKREIAPEVLKLKKVALVTGIANPSPLVKYLESLGLLFKHYKFKDHHFFTEKEINDFANNDYVITTEKDFVRLNGKVENLFYVEVRHQFLFDGDLILSNSLKKAVTLHLQS
ncbi:tetraacyldisaccharide 4'-kinase [Croceitalea sp. P059]|uniref:tetraacyldisaccharide 4'-kinase n=1 Tax=Croceitalea sp. P059 TaxID=3075601 RepID=UPI002885A1B9|nr:tetraacyldisaccharide 4'-kinase [Croceitalea sp. P059]MDT0540990.1 tetraacyldisaccharide 4'-kinase [Croceitalea sp. P059]